MIDTSLWVQYKALDYSQFENSVNKRIYAASMEQDRSYWFFVATKGIGPRALLTTVSIEFLESQKDVNRIGSVAINLCLKNVHQETVFKSRSFLEESGFWAPEADTELAITSPKANFVLTRGYFADVETAESDLQQLDIELDAFIEAANLDRALL